MIWKLKTRLVLFRRYKKLSSVAAHVTKLTNHMVEQYLCENYPIFLKSKSKWYNCCMLWWIQNPPNKETVEHLFAVTSNDESFDEEIESLIHNKEKKP